MIDFSLLTKIGTIISLIKETPLLLILFFGFLLMIIDCLFISKNSKNTVIIYIILSSIITILIVSPYFNTIINVFDAIGKNIVAIIYFPTVLEYIVAIIVSIVILLFSLLSKKSNNIIKFINASIFAVIVLLFLLIVNQLSINTIDLTNKVSVYSNDHLLILFEFSMLLFAVWIILLTLIKIIKVITHRKEDVIKESISLETTTNTIELPKLVSSPVVNNNSLVINSKEEDMFTLEEYQQIKKLLDILQNNNN